MFSSDKKKTVKSKEDLVMERNKISKKTIFKGEITSKGDFRVDGTIDGGLITTGKIIVGPEGKIFGKVKCLNADIEGVLEGHIEVKKSLCLKPSSKVSGEVYIESLTVEPGAVFNANCKMLNSVKEVDIKLNEKTKEKEQHISKVS